MSRAHGWRRSGRWSDTTRSCFVTHCASASSPRSPSGSPARSDSHADTGSPSRSVIILQPYTGATTLRALQRGMGTVVGGVLTAALGALFHGPIAILVMSFVFAAVSVALLPINYAAFSLFLTPTFVLLAEASAGDWHLGGVRVFDTLLGGALALLGARFLWPAPERKRAPAYLAATIESESRLSPRRRLDVRGQERGGGPAHRVPRRRDVALAAINAEESFHRLMGEHGGRTDELTPAMTLLAYARRFTVSIAALAVSRHSVDAVQAEALAPFAKAATQRWPTGRRRSRRAAPRRRSASCRSRRRGRCRRCFGAG